MEKADTLKYQAGQPITGHQYYTVDIDNLGENFYHVYLYTNNSVQSSAGTYEKTTAPELIDKSASYREFF
jgi:hypothetical protein